MTSQKQVHARNRNHLIMRLRGAYYTMREVIAFCPSAIGEVYAAEKYIDRLLKAMGAEPEGIRRARRQEELKKELLR